jgi:hypothetical protein
VQYLRKVLSFSILQSVPKYFFGREAGAPKLTQKSEGRSTENPDRSEVIKTFFLLNRELSCMDLSTHFLKNI